MWEDWKKSRNCDVKNELVIGDIISMNRATLQTCLCHFILKIRQKIIHPLEQHLEADLLLLVLTTVLFHNSVILATLRTLANLSSPFFGSLAAHVL